MADRVTTKRTLGEGSGKLILFGEHAVVHGRPAIVAGLGAGATASAHLASEALLRVRSGLSGELVDEVSPDDDVPLARAYAAILAEFEVSGPLVVDAVLHVPVGAGLGSSAALAVAVSRAIETVLGESPSAVERAVAASEQVFHGTPSGVDQAAAMGGGVFRFEKPDKIEPLTVPPVRLLVCQAEAGASTAEMVAGVRELSEALPTISASVFDAIGGVVDEAERALIEGEWEQVGALMNLNHGLLCSLGVSTFELDSACHLARIAGAWGAKLTGAGGGGCVFALAPQDAEEAVVAAWGQQGYSTFAFDLHPQGTT